MIKDIFPVIIGLSAGVIVAGAIFAFIAAVGIVPRLAHKTGTNRYIKIFEESIIIGGIAGVSTYLFDYTIPIKLFGAIPIALGYGMFVGCFALCLAEIFNVFPIMARRTNIQRGIGIFIFSFALGKLVGSLLYFLKSGFFENM